jgi:AcrR family transcriptional regulator
VTILAAQPATADAASPVPGVEARAVAALLTCIARFGLAKTNLDDVAREAGCSRATLYRYFSSKSDLLEQMVLTELERITALAVAAGGSQHTFADAVVATAVTTARALVAHDALQFLIAHEPDAVLGHLAFEPGDRVLVLVGDALAPAFLPWLKPTGAARAGEWLTRVLRSYVLMPNPPIDLTDAAAARRFLEQLVVPGLEAEGHVSRTPSRRKQVTP